jgi:carboxypeptidase Q
MRRSIAAAIAGATVLGGSCIGVGTAEERSADPATLATLARIRTAATNSDWAWRQLARLTDEIGPRLSGSPGHAAAITQVAAAMRALGARVTLQPVKVPHWVRGEERAELTRYPGRTDGLTQQLHLTTLGGSSATPPAGLEAPVIVLRDFDDLRAHGAEVRGKIVLFDSRFDQRLADSGQAGAAYEQAGEYRFRGPSEAAALGAAAALVRSIGGADYRLPHTGVTRWKDHQSPIPAAALAAEDADLVERLAAAGQVSMKLLLTPQTLPDADSDNVIADWPGTDRPGEYVVVSGHLDSWDLGTGATDDGVGVMGAAGVIQVLQQLDLHPRRTIRFIAWTNEENGSRGAKAYIDSVSATLNTQCAAIESDDGAGRSLGVEAAVTKDSLSTLQVVAAALAPLGATIIEPREGEVGADIEPLQAAGVPGFAPLVDARHYFDYHHTAADTLDKVDPANFASQIATMAVLAYYLADLPECLPRVPAAR